MISKEWVGVILWAIAGLFVLIAPKRVSKLEYGLVWMVLIMNLIAKALTA